ncbi:MAG: hypothetical protein JXJ19_01465 [Elusimicrobia bacterium]|nr:hypothetical protein [Elusimicrobiota bacterium]
MRCGISLKIILFFILPAVSGCLAVRERLEYEPCSVQDTGGLEVSAFIDMRDRDPRIVVDITNCSERDYFIRNVLLYCSGGEVGVKSFEEEEGEFLKIPQGERMQDIVDYFNSVYDSPDFIDFVCSGASEVRVETVSQKEFSAPVEIRE